MDFEGEHRGIKFYYSENMDKWVAHSLSLEADTLSKLKDKINRLLSSTAKGAGVKCLIIRRYSGDDELLEGQILSAPTSREVSVGTFSKPKTKIIYSVLVSYNEGNKTRRSTFELDQLAVDCPEARAIWDSVIAHRKVARAHEDDAEKLCATIPRMTIDLLPNMRPEEK